MTRERDIGVALSGGGHRATVFGLGALLALVDEGLNQQVTSISSVSGGSIANGVVMTGPDYSTVDRAGFEAHLGPPLQSIASRGVLLGGWRRPAPATATYLIVLVAVLLLCALAFLGVLVFAVANLWAAMAMAAVTWLGCLALGWWLFRQRSVRIERAVDKELLGAKLVALADVQQSASRVHHVICTTELQSGDAYYFTNRAVYGYKFGGSTGACPVPLATAVQASASVPGAFAPRKVKLSDLGRGPVTVTNSKGEQTEVSEIVLNDGGTYDNMADQWEYGYPGRSSSWETLADIQPERGSHIVVVNGSGGWNDIKPIKPGLGFGDELAGLSRSQGVQYDVSTARRRQALFDRFNDTDNTPDKAMSGVFVQITDSPYRYPHVFATEPARSSDPERAERAEKALTFLREHSHDEAEWKKIVDATSSVETTLARLGTDCTAKLLEHGYVLTMVNLYVVSGRGSLHEIDRKRLQALCT